MAIGVCQENLLQHERSANFAVIDPFDALTRRTHTAEIAYSVMQPNDRSSVHTHSGREGVGTAPERSV